MTKKAKRPRCYRCDKFLTDENTAPSTFAKGRGHCRKCSSIVIKRKRRKNPKLFIVNRVRGNSKRRGLEFSITVDDIPDFPKRCPVFPWIKLKYRVGGGLPISLDAPSLDRINNDLGYIPGNIRIISYRANELKRNATLKELRALYLDAKKTLKN